MKLNSNYGTHITCALRLVDRLHSFRNGFMGEVGRQIAECWVGQPKESILPGFFDLQGKRNGLQVSHVKNTILTQ